MRADGNDHSALFDAEVSRRSLLLGVGSVLGSAVAASLVKPGSARAATDPTLTSSSFDWMVDPSTGGVFTLSNPSDSYGTNYVINSTTEPQFAITDSRWFGDLIFYVTPAGASSGTEMTTGLSGDIRTVKQSGSTIAVTYNGTPANANGINGFTVVETYKLNAAGTQVTWSITVTNTSSTALTFEDFGFPLLMDSYWSGSQTNIYQQCVGRHSFIGENGSYIYWQRPNGVGPFLLMTPGAGTSLEFKNKARAGEGPFAEVDPYWEGVNEFYIHSANVAVQREQEACTYLPMTSLSLAAGASQTYSFTFRWAADYPTLRQAVYNSGVVDVVSLPGMVIPQDRTATLAVRAKSGITSVTGQSGQNIGITSAGTANGYSLYHLTFPTLGPNQVTVSYGTAQTSVLQYYSIAPLETLLPLHTTFLVDNQQAVSTHSYNGAFLQWDMSLQELITWANYPGGGWEQWMAGGSDDLGLSPAEFLSQKNLAIPVQAEVSAIDNYITSFLLGFLQSATSGGVRTWQVYRWYDGQDGTPYDTGVWRAYNYVHITNTYFNMYRISRAYPRLTMQYTALEYLNMCYQTIVAMFTKIPQPTPIGDAAHDFGLMGESTYPEIIAALGVEGLSSEQSQVQGYVTTKAQYFASEAYPFASEQSIDTTAFESVYTLAKMTGNTTLVTSVLNASMACRGLQPVWYWYGSDNRNMGESWWNLSYETPIGAWVQQDYLENYGTPGTAAFDEIMRSTGGAFLAGWANINSGQIDPNTKNIGATAWIYQAEGGANEYGYIPNLNNWWSWSGEAELGLWGAVRAAAVNVVNDGIVGLYAYNGDVVLTKGVYTITPHDAIHQRFTVFPAGALTVSLANARYSSATVKSDRSVVTLSLVNVTSGSYTAKVTLASLPSGTYLVTVSGTTQAQTITSTGVPLTVTLPTLSAATNVVKITKVT